MAGIFTSVVLVFLGIEPRAFPERLSRALPTKYPVMGPRMESGSNEQILLLLPMGSIDKPLRAQTLVKSFIQHLLSAYYVPGTVLGAEIQRCIRYSPCP